MKFFTKKGRFLEVLVVVVVGGRRRRRPCHGGRTPTNQPTNPLPQQLAARCAVDMVEVEVEVAGVLS